MNTTQNKRIAKNTLMMYIRMLSVMVISLFTSRVVLETLGIVDFGIYNVVGGIVIMFAFLNGTLGSGTQRFITFYLGENNLETSKKIFSISLIIHFIIAVVILALAETVGLWFLNNKLNIPVDRIVAAQWVYQFSVFASVLTIIQVPYNASIIAHENMKIYALVSVVEVCLKLIAVYTLLILKFDKLILYSILIFGSNFIVMLCYRIYCTCNYAECKFQIIWDKKIATSMLTFSGWNIFGVLAFTGANQGINILLNIFFGPSINAARAISFQVNAALDAFVTNFQTAVSPQIVKLYAEKKNHEMHKLLYQNSKYAFLMIYFISLPVIFELNLLLHLWLKIVPDQTVLFCRIILLQTMLYTVSRPFIIATHAVGKMKNVNLTGGTSLLLVLPISYIFLKLGFSAEVPFIVYVVGTLAEFYFVFYYLNKYVNLSFRDLSKYTIVPSLKVILISLPHTLFVYFSMEEGLLRLIIIVFLTSLTIIVSTYFVATDASTKKTINSFITEKLNNFLNKNI